MVKRGGKTLGALRFFFGFPLLLAGDLVEVNLLWDDHERWQAVNESSCGDSSKQIT